ncbi:MAG: acetylglucosamine transferase [Candidatus Accumulibacter sp.]|uniref:O-linked N-acetylglucosamine transferase, SPINDLY family protein n=1 Tax=Accumulibacter sp. TaxID=2053492 RepID=UPI0025831056|nr:acetylglucosamine transferase [Accumulibacter sp.]MCM8621666.1 acetylglucosamine transferase [Accumulibacter sp.]
MRDDVIVSLLMQAWNGQLELLQLIDQCSKLEQERRAPLAAILYQTWLKRTPSTHAHAAYFNLGATLSNLGDLVASEEAYRQAIALSPGFIQPRLNLGLVLERRGFLDQAVEEWLWVERNVPADTDEYKPFLLLALNNLGRVLEIKKEYRDATDYLDRSLSIDPTQSDVLHHWVFLRMKQCCWPVYRPTGKVSPELMENSTSALAMLAMTDDPAEQLAAARRYADKKVLKDLPSLAKPGGYGHRKIRIGYCSSDFCLHPVAMLMVEMFESHDREKFEVYAYCWSPEDGSEVRKRVIAAMDHFQRIDQLGDEEAACLIREHEIDILVDLQGQTAGARMNMLAYRPAPIQITYLGLPATTGLPFIDYVIADRFLIPEEEARYYSEMPLYMPDIYQVSDRKRALGTPPSRASCGLPEDRFVYCSFNNNFKFTPEMFSVWMNILRRVSGSVLWLLADNPWAETNLRQEAINQGIEPSRLIFTERVAPENYLARYQIADLFLDTFPFNAGTTANDALWMGLPVLTRSGRTFASRMAGALLTAANLGELITYQLSDYEEKAVALGHRRTECERMRAHLIRERTQGVLFDTHLFVRNLESRLLQLTMHLPTTSSPL